MMFTPVPTPPEMAGWDARTIELGFSEDVLMENAARSAFDCLKRRFGAPLKGKKALLFAGSGNNGGDAFCMARLLLEAEAIPAVVCTRPPRAGGAAKRWFDVLGHLEIPLASPDEWLGSQACADADIIIDGLLGTGFHGLLRETEACLVKSINRSDKAFILSIDIPSGLDGMTGLPCPDAVRADATASFQAPKPGLLMPESSAYTGTLDIYPIGMPKKACVPASFRTWRIPCQEKDDSGPWTVCRGEASENIFSSPPVEIPLRKPKHKGEAGRVLVIGGCRAYAGAPCLAALASMRAGCGMAAVAAPDPVQAALRNICPAAVSLMPPHSPCPGEWDRGYADHIVCSLEKYDAVVIGPGLGRGNTESYLTEAVLSAKGRPPAVIDADALHAISIRPALFGSLTEKDILTPHPGEAAALLGVSSREVQSDRPASLRRLTALCGAVCILKGEGSLIAAQNETPVISPWSVPQLAVAGSGDVLAGIAAAFLAQGLPAMEAASLSVWTHALAGVSLAKEFPLRGNSPMEIAARIPRAMQLAGLPQARTA